MILCCIVRKRGGNFEKTNYSIYQDFDKKRIQGLIHRKRYLKQLVLSIFLSVLLMVINPNNIKTLFDEINLDDNKNKLSTKDLSNVSLTMRPIDKYINVWHIKTRHHVV